MSAQHTPGPWTAVVVVAGIGEGPSKRIDIAPLVLEEMNSRELAEGDAYHIACCICENLGDAHPGQDVSLLWSDAIEAAALTEALQQAAHEGWLACRREVFSIAEATLNAGISSEFERGRCFEAKGIAKAMGAMCPENSDELRAAIAKATGSAA